MTIIRRSIIALFSVFAFSSAQAQDQLQGEVEKEITYFPLFSEEMITNASPEQATRMRETENRNRSNFDERQQSLRERKTDQQSSSNEARVDPRPPVNSARNKSKIYKWVDRDGRVHFGDAPQSKTATEVKVGGAARIQGVPPPPPTLSNDPDK